MLPHIFCRIAGLTLLLALPLAAQAAGNDFEGGSIFFLALFLAAFLLLCLLPVGLVFLLYHIRDSISDRSDSARNCP